MEVPEIGPDDMEVPAEPEMVPAIGTALYDDMNRLETTISGLLVKLEKGPLNDEFIGNRLDPLFRDDDEYKEWSSSRMRPIGRASSLKELKGKKCFLGVDSGSTTTKVVLTDDKGNIAFHYYAGNKGDPITAVGEGLKVLKKEAKRSKINPDIAYTAVTGYGEDLIGAAFGMDVGMVETLAHFRAATEFLEDVSFILDIGGQDMKAVFIHKGIINDIEINEACSSGCGSFLETFARTLGLEVQDFAEEACHSRAPYDLGTRCTVFMNSKVKQALREGATVGDISAGLAFSVVKNCLYKVLKIKDTDILGDNIVVQGGTFRNPAVHRALELILGKRVVCSDMPELMGAYGSALTAAERWNNRSSSFIGLNSLEKAVDLKNEYIKCKGCHNHCTVTKMTFGNGKVFYTGNKCERIFTNIGGDRRKGIDLTERKLQLLFEGRPSPKGNIKGRIGMPRVLNIYENFPFWDTLLRECGFDVVLSPPSTNRIAELGSRTIMSENICFPAKIVNGHIKELISMGVDRIFYPMVVFEEDEFEGSLNTFNCPIVSGYPDVVRSAVAPERSADIPFDSPTVSFRNKKIMKTGIWKYLKELKVEKRVFERALNNAIDAQKKYKEIVKREASEILQKARSEKRVVVLLVGRPYHIDQLINHRITEMISALGADVITEDSVPDARGGMDGVQVLTQWEYPNRVYNAVKWAKDQDNVEVVQLNSFGCGPDAIVCDESRAILASAGKNHTLIRIDEVSSPGSIRLRLRSMMESLERKGLGSRYEPIPRKRTPPFSASDRDRTMIVPFFSRFFSPYIVAAFKSMGYNIETLPEPDRESVEVGLKYCNNEICYPAIIVIGDLIKALQSGKYDLGNVAVGITQTGGQCRASSYLSLLQKALQTSGYEDIPVVTVTLSNQKLNDQPGLKLDKGKLLRRGVQGLLFSDSIMELYYAIAPREKVRGTSREISDRYIALGAESVRYGREMELPDALERAVKEFNSVDIIEDEIPTVGYVGEIYVKYNPFGNFHVVDWMVENRIEVIVPPIFDFFAQEFLNPRFHVDCTTKGVSWKYISTWPEEWYVRYHMRRYEKALRKFRFHRKTHYIGSLSKHSSDVVTLVDQFGEGWLIPAEIGAFAASGVQNVVCVQPFGCISNHIIGKGVEKALKAKYPDLNVLYLDMDAGSSEVNLFNRLNFIVRSAREDLYEKQKNGRISA